MRYAVMQADSKDDTVKRPSLIRNPAHIDRDRGYRFTDRDPILEFIANDITDSGWPLAFISERSGVAKATLYKWMNGQTRHPQNITVEAVLVALGWTRTLERDADE